MSQFRANPNEHEGRRGSRIDSEEGGRYLGIPPHHSQRTHLSVTINPVSSESGAVQAVLDSSVEHSLQKLEVVIRSGSSPVSHIAIGLALQFFPDE